MTANNMTNDELGSAVGDTKFTYLVAKSLKLPWNFRAQECATVQDVMTLFRHPTFAGGVVTMPYKIGVMEHLDGLDDHAKQIGACNNVYRTKDGSLRGTNTDWRGIRGCLASGTMSKTGEEGRRKPALIVGAGGAARAALYTLHHEFQCSPIYVANRDATEVEALAKDTKRYENLDLVYLPTLAAARHITQEGRLPFFVVGTVPDFAPKSPSELEVHAILEHCFADAEEKGVLLDMCFKPRITRTVKMAQKHSWSTVEGVDVIGHQIHEQYRLWTGPIEESPITTDVQEDAWRVLHKAADENAAINF